MYVNNATVTFIWGRKKMGSIVKIKGYYLLMFLNCKKGSRSMILAFYDLTTENCIYKEKIFPEIPL